MSPTSAKAKAYISLVVALGLTVLMLGLARWECPAPGRYLSYLIISTLASGLKVSLPGIMGTMSMNFLFILIGIVELSLPEVLLMGCAGTVVQCIWKAKSRVKPVQVLFSACNLSIAVFASYFVYHSFQKAGLELRLDRKSVV